MRGECATVDEKSGSLWFCPQGLSAQNSLGLLNRRYLIFRAGSYYLQLLTFDLSPDHFDYGHVDIRICCF